MDTVRPERSYPPIWRIIAAFLIVPGVAALVMAIMMPAYDGISDPLERIWRSALVFAVVGAYPATVILGLPAFLILRRRFEATLLNCSLTGAVAAALPWLILSSLITPDSASTGGRATVLHGSLTPYGWLTNLTFIGQIALFGAGGGMLFWLFAAAGWKIEKVDL
ncbi:hypothetical protein [Sphingomonas sp. PP-CE-1G-424]|uniref:hypothetical protein n=1 Tax=Sphingomonas sp. PP-CE-1G-424 TaxID=2135658 RepID=UPI0014052EC0|nr:hypothetical protein [Sphingomonas sp. PP-CE-1G-424]